VKKFYVTLEVELRRSLDSKESAAVLHGAGARHVDLSAYPSVPAALAAMANPDTTTYPDKESITRAAISECQKYPHNFWVSFLLLAFLPMLRRIRYRVRPTVISADDLDQSVIDSFLCAVRDFPLDLYPTHTCLQLRRATQRAVFSAVNMEIKMANSAVEYRDEIYSETCSDSTPLGDRIPATLSADDREDASHTLRKRLSRYMMPNPALDLVAESARTPRRLRALVQAALWDQDEEVRERTYQRVKKARNRLKHALRPILDGTAGRQLVLPLGGLAQTHSSLFELVQDLVWETKNVESDFAACGQGIQPLSKRTEKRSEPFEGSGVGEVWVSDFTPLMPPSKYPISLKRKNGVLEASKTRMPTFDKPSFAGSRLGK